MEIRYLNQPELAARWRISGRTLERWRWVGQGPRYHKIGGRVVYRLDDIEAGHCTISCSWPRRPELRAVTRR